MADWYGAARSNYFAVKDEAAFRAALKNISVDVVEENGRFALLSEDQFGGWPSYRSHDDARPDEDPEEIDVATLVSGHLAEGEVAVFMETGAEKLGYLSGHAVAINAAGDIKTLSLDDIYPLARELGPNVTEASW